MLLKVWRLVAVALFAALLPSSSLAQRFWDTPAGGSQVGGAVVLCLNGTNKAVPCSATSPLSASVVSEPTAASTSCITPVVSTAAEANHILKASAGNLYGVSVTTGAVAGYVLIFNATSAPTDGAVTPLFCYVIPAVSSLSVEWKVPAAFSTGVTVSFSSSGCFTKTASATAMFSGTVK